MVLLVSSLLLPAVVHAALTPEQIEAKLKELDAKIEEAVKCKAELEALKAELQQKPAAPKPSWTDTIKFNGYFQNRYENRKYAGAGGFSDFFMRRFYLNIIATPNDRTLGVVTIERAGPSDPGLTLAQAFAQYKLDDLWSVRFGQATNNMGIDTAQSSSQRIPLDRAMASEGNSLLGLRGIYWRGWNDRGLWFVRQADGCLPLTTVGVMNGQFSDRGGPGVGKSIEADLKWPASWGYAGASYMNGKYLQRKASGDAADGTINNRNAVVLYALKNPDPWGGQAEWFDGKLPGLSATSPGDRRFGGWYVQGVYDTGGKGFPFVRYEQYDQNKDAPGKYTAWHFGYKWRVNKCSEITAQIDRGNNHETDLAPVCGAPGVPGSANMYGVQWQFSF